MYSCLSCNDIGFYRIQPQGWERCACNPPEVPPSGPMKVIAHGLADFFASDPKKITHWLLTDNPHFGGLSPAGLIVIRGDRGLEKVAAFVKAALAGNKPQ